MAGKGGPRLHSVSSRMKRHLVTGSLEGRGGGQAHSAPRNTTAGFFSERVMAGDSDACVLRLPAQLQSPAGHPIYLRACQNIIPPKVLDYIPVLSVANQHEARSLG
ncbi:hypothetical protein IMZ48_35655 [Candidatus Bathyarchaeota archaeon]|nr:hypothetical protein [Candidatus Bathyarchaeota archaeon]